MNLFAILVVGAFVLLLMRFARPDEAGAATAAAPASPGLGVKQFAGGPALRLSVGQMVRRYTIEDMDVWRVVTVGSGPINSRAWLVGTLAEVPVPLGTTFELAQSGEPGGPVTKISTPLATVPPNVARLAELAEIKSQISSILSRSTAAPTRLNASGDMETYTPDVLKAQGFGEYYSSQFPALGIRLVNAQNAANIDALLVRVSQYSFAEQVAAGF